jgi:hypothetical protein
MENYVRERFPSVAQDDHSDYRNDDNEDGGEHESAASQSTEPTPNIAPPRMRKQGNTGPKGVLADYADHMEDERLKREMAQLKTEWMMKKISITTLTAREQEELRQRELEQERKLEDEREGDANRKEKEDDFEDDEDDEFFVAYKSKR